MKVKTISRSEDHSRKTSLDIYKVSKNLNPELHPFERAREYTRALNATKLSRLFAKPFVSALSGHIDGVYCMAKHPNKLTFIASGSGDGQVKLWSLDNRSCPWTVQAHNGFVKGLSFAPFSKSERLVSVGDDKTVKVWNTSEYETDPLQVFTSKYSFTGVDHHGSDPLFATSSSQIDIWNYDRSEPVQSFNWGVDTITTVKMNQTERNILASCGTDRNITLYDLRSQTPLSKVILEMRTNAICWNPMEAFNFSTVFFSFIMYRLII